MNEWRPQDWAFILTAVGTVVTAVIAAVGAVFANLAKIKSESNEKKIDENTRITTAGTKSATAASVAAAKTAVEAKVVATEMAQTINKKLNGGIDAAIADAIRPVQTVLEAHTVQDAKDLEEVKVKFDDLTTYVHERNHDVLNVLQVQSNNIAIIMKKLGIN